MAIYHFSVKTISRSAGRSAVACSAYRSGEKLIDERQGKEQDYTRKTGVEFTKIYVPENTNPELLDRNQLWNTVEKVERRKDANLAREFEIAFPHELNAEQRQAMLNELCEELVKRHGVIVDAAIHAPHTQSGSDERNYHAHIMFTGRQIDLETGDFAKKRNRDFNKENSSQTVNQWRETFADLTNQHLARAGYLSKVDHRSYADQDNGLQATIHEGPAVTQLRRKGIDTEISLKNDLIKQQNTEKQHLPEILKGLEQEIFATEKLQSKLEADLLEAKQQEQQRLEAEKLERDVSRFYDLQAHYCEFAKLGIKLELARLEEIEKVSNRERKTKAEIAKIRAENPDSVGSDSYLVRRKYGDKRPRYWVESNEAADQYKQINNEYKPQIKALADEYDLERTAAELVVLHRHLNDQGVELEIPRANKVLSWIGWPSTNPSAETVIDDMQKYFYPSLPNSFRHGFEQSIRTEEQKKKDTQKAIEEQKKKDAQKAIEEQNAREEQQHRMTEEEHTKKIKKTLDTYGYDLNNFDYEVNNMTTKVISKALGYKNCSRDYDQKIELIERCINQDCRNKKNTYPDYLDLIKSDEKFFEDRGYDDLSKKASAFHEKLRVEYAERLETERLEAEAERLRIEKDLLESQRVKSSSLTNDLKKDNDNDLSM